MNIWATIVGLALKIIYRLDYKVIGAENLDRSTPSIVVANHQSAWETILCQIIFPNLVWVVKKELIWFPFFGQLMYVGGAITIDRNKGRKSMLNIVRQGKDRINRGLWILFFAEGTRQKAGELAKLKPGASQLAVMLKVPVYAVVHNSGSFWPKNSMNKNSGTITLHISPKISSHNKSAQELNEEIEAWMKNNYPH